ncbi:MAG: glucose-1-phosphate cytidylyltransferase [Nostoc sp. CmiVER01]|uniref:glucose-1-phosphate cytidylyltransferase n=1 Tax=Nostoc sp. CmiVER01 TaxID=3075384 RepID=UPI002AD59813|nr:glucose-1-phosphate cytidylyltransferase [Nostoc sp. CmiVER01]MDZ8121340.1 glucose-1-phosphate cytidylyltransferase [Nostoc sp. CmiVER01]
MKVVLFCGGLGTRLRELSSNIPKPMVHIGYRPILWHVMKYYAHYGHKDFILCLGYKADVIKNYFLNYDECVSNDFTLQEGGRKIQLVNSDIEDWNITFVDTGLTSNIGQRFKAVEKYLDGEEVFLANYSDGLTDLHLPDLIEDFYRHKKIASFLCVKPSQSFHLVSTQENGLVNDIQSVQQAGIRINGGFFVFNKDIFKYIESGEELVLEPFQRLIKIKELVAYKYNGFWACMDTFKEQQQLDDMYCQGNAPWAVWNLLERKAKYLEYSRNYQFTNDSVPISLANS